MALLTRPVMPRHPECIHGTPHLQRFIEWLLGHLACCKRVKRCAKESARDILVVIITLH